MKLKVTLVESAPGRSGRENDELPLVIMVPVLDARTTIRALARRVEADIAETFGTDTVETGIVRDNSGVALPPSALVVDLLEDNDAIFIDKARNINSDDTKKINGRRGQKEDEDALAEAEARTSAAAQSFANASNSQSGSSEADEIARAWEDGTCSLLDRLVSNVSGRFYSTGALAMLSCVSVHSSARIRLCSARALLAIVERWVVSTAPNIGADDTIMSGESSLANSLIPSLVALLPERSGSRRHNSMDGDAASTVQCSVIASRALLRILNAGAVSPSDVIFTSSPPSRTSVTDALVSLVGLLDGVGSSGDAATVLALIELLVSDESARLEFMKSGLVTQIIASGLVTAAHIGQVAANLLVRLSVGGHGTVDMGSAVDTGGNKNPDDKALAADTNTRGMGLGDEKLPLPAIAALLVTGKADLHRIAAIALQAWLPLLQRGDEGAVAVFITQTRATTNAETDGLALVWKMAMLGDGCAIAAASVAAAVSAISFEGKDAVTRGRGMGTLVRWIRGDNMGCIDDESIEKVRHLACSTLAVAVLHEIVQKRVERLAGLGDRCPILALMNVLTVSSPATRIETKRAAAKALASLSASVEAARKVIANSDAFSQAIHAAVHTPVVHSDGVLLAYLRGFKRYID